MPTKIIVDSGCDLPQIIINDYDIEILPFNIHLDNKTYRDGIDIVIEDVYSALREGKIPTTSQVSLNSFEDTFTRNARKRNDCIYISFSSKLSGAYQAGRLIAAQVKKQFPKINIDVVDSKSGSVAIGVITYKAAQLLREGVSRLEVINKIKYWADHIEHLFILDNLKTLVRGGRISKTSSLIADVLNIKPILHLNDGKIELLQKVRGTKNSINKLVELFKEKSFNIKEQLIGIAHGGNLEDAEKLTEKIQEIGGEIFCIKLISSVLGVHLGIGGIGLFFLNEA